MLPMHTDCAELQDKGLSAVEWPRGHPIASAKSLAKIIETISDDWPPEGARHACASSEIRRDNLSQSCVKTTPRNLQISRNQIPLSRQIDT